MFIIMKCFLMLLCIPYCPIYLTCPQATTEVLPITIDYSLHFLEFCINITVQHVLVFCLIFLTQHNYLSFIHLQYKSVVHPFLLLSSIQLYGYSIVCLSIHLLRIYDQFSVFVYHKYVCFEYLCRCLCTNVFISLGKMSECNGVCMFNF